MSTPKTNKVPVILISGVSNEPMAAATITLQWDLPAAVVVRHQIDPERERLTRIVSDASGVLEQLEIDVEHACTSCAIRQDVVPTLERLAADGRWSAIIAHLPVTAEPTQVCRVIGHSPEVAAHVRVSASLVALEGGSIRDDLVGDDLMVERHLPVRDDDERGVGEVASAMVEYADVVAIFGTHDEPSWELVRALARPGAVVTNSLNELDTEMLRVGIHSHDHSEDWVAVVRRDELTQNDGELVWTLDFHSERPFHPDRLQGNIERLGRGMRRSRGCFWLPSRPSQVCQWDGAGGMVSIGPAHHWEKDDQLTRIVVVGVGEGREELAEAFTACLLTDTEMAERDPYWEVGDDGFEPWLGPVRNLTIRDG